MMAAGLIALAPQAAQAAPGSKTFNTSGGLNQAWVVPADVHSLDVKVNGAAGGAGGFEGGSGGRGASGTVTVPVTPGDTITVYLGKRGGDAGTDNPATEGVAPAAAGAAKGGNGGEGAAFSLSGAGGAGGGATEVFVGAASDDNRAIVAGGGGGGGGYGGLHTTPGNGGGADEDGQSGDAPESEGGHAGDAATQAGGVGDSAYAFTTGGGGGGGGGGFQGGSQGATWTTSGGAGGGGGRSYVNPLFGELDGSWANNVEGDGSVVITYSSQYATGVTIDDPNTVVTGQMKGYKVSVGATAPGQLPTGSIELTAESLADGTVYPLGTKNLVNGTTTIYQDGLKVGDYVLHATYTPNGVSDSLPSSADRPFSVVKGDTTTLLAGPVDVPNFGDSVDLGVSVSPVAPAKGIPTGKVQFFANGSPIPGGLKTLDGDGKAVLTTTKLPVGTYEVRANYLGDDEFNASLDEVSLGSFTVNQGDVAITLEQEHPTAVSGEKSKFKVVVKSLKDNGTKPTGDVQLYVDDQPLGGAVAINATSGEALFTFELPVSEDGHHHIRAVYVGDSNFHEATSAWIDHVVNFGDAKVKLSSDLNPSHVGNEVTFSIDVDGLLPTQPYEPTGQVQLYVNGSAFNGPVDIDGDGKATVATDDLPVGANKVYAQYLGDSRYNEASSGELSQIVEKQLSVVTLSANAAELQYGETLTLTAHVDTEKGDLAKGFIQFYDQGVALGDPVLVDGEGNATVSSNKVSKGPHQYTAEFFGSDNEVDGVSNTVEVTILKNTLQFKLITNKVPAYEGEEILLHARLQADAGSKGKIAGTIQYYTDGKKYGLPVPVNGQNWGSKVVRKLKPGLHRFSAKFVPSADSPFESNFNAGVIQRVQKGDPNARVRMSVKRTSESTGDLRVRVRKDNGKYSGGFVQIYVDGVPTKLLKLKTGGAVTTYTLTDLPDRHVIVTANFRPRGSTKQAGKSLTLYRF